MAEQKLPPATEIRSGEVVSTVADSGYERKSLPRRRAGIFLERWK